MKELPYFRFTCQEWQNGDITLESMATQGVFINICSYYWMNNCDITKKQLIKKYKQNNRIVKELIINNLLQVEDDCICIRFLDTQWDELQEFRAKKQIAGSKGGKQKASNAKAKLQHNSSYKDKENYKDKEKDNIKKGKKNKHSFESSPYFDKNYFSDYFKDWGKDQLNHYYNAALEYSGSKGEKYLNWGLAIKSWERRKPYKSNKPKTFAEQDDENLGSFIEKMELKTYGQPGMEPKKIG